MQKGETILASVYRAVLDAIKYVESVNGKVVKGDEFVPDGQVYKTEQQARFAAEYPEIERTLLHETNEVDKRLNNA